MFEINAMFSRKENKFETTGCIVEKVIRLSGAEYDRFTSNMLRDQDFIKENNDIMRPDSNGKTHCLLVIGEGRRDGVLVDSSGSDYARYTAFIPNVEDLLTVGRYSALAELNKKLATMVDTIAAEAGVGNSEGRGVVNLQDWETLFGIDLMTNAALRNTVLSMLDERPEIEHWELDKDELTVYRNTDGLENTVEDLSDSSVTREDMYALGYGYDHMIPLRTERALELFDEGHEIFRLYRGGFDIKADSRRDIEVFDGIFGVKNPAWTKSERPDSIEVFIVNREGFEANNIIGEWLTLPAEANELSTLLTRIEVDRPSEGALSIAAVRLPYDNMHTYVTKYDSLDELNMLASYMNDMEDYEIEKFQAILSTNIVNIGTGTAALINLLDADNFEAFNLIDAHNAEEVGRYYAEEDYENESDKPDDFSFEDYGRHVMSGEEGVFTKQGYIYCKYGELIPEYNGVVPDEYKIVAVALLSLRTITEDRGGSDEKQSVIDRIRASRTTPHKPKERDTQKPKKDKGGTEL